MSLLMEKSLNRLRGSCRQFPPAETRDMKQGRSCLRPDRSFGICGFRFPEYQEHKYRADRDGKDHAEDQVGNDTCGESPMANPIFPFTAPEIAGMAPMINPAISAPSQTESIVIPPHLIFLFPHHTPTVYFCQREILRKLSPIVMPVKTADPGQ